MVVAGGAAAIAADVAVDEDVDFELLLWLCEPASPMTISTAMTAKTMTHLGTDCFFGDPVAAGGGAAGPEFLPSEAQLPAPDGSGCQPGAGSGGGGCVIAETVRAPRAVVEDGWSVSSVWCTCNGRHLAWRCWCGAVLRAAARAALPTNTPP